MNFEKSEFQYEFRKIREIKKKKKKKNSEFLKVRKKMLRQTKILRNEVLRGDADGTLLTSFCDPASHAWE